MEFGLSVLGLSGTHLFLKYPEYFQFPLLQWYTPWWHFPHQTAWIGFGSVSSTLIISFTPNSFRMIYCFWYKFQFQLLLVCRLTDLNCWRYTFDNFAPRFYSFNMRLRCVFVHWFGSWHWPNGTVKDTGDLATGCEKILDFTFWLSDASFSQIAVRWVGFSTSCLPCVASKTLLPVSGSFSRVNQEVRFTSSWTSLSAALILVVVQLDDWNPVATTSWWAQNLGTSFPSELCEPGRQVHIRLNASLSAALISTPVIEQRDDRNSHPWCMEKLLHIFPILCIQQECEPVCTTICQWSEQWSSTWPHNLSNITLQGVRSMEFDTFTHFY